MKECDRATACSDIQQVNAVAENSDVGVAARLAQAIHNKTLASDARMMLNEAGDLSKDEQHLLEQAMATCDQIRNACVREGNEMAGRFRDAGISCRFDPEEVGDPQFHHIRIEIESSDPSTAIEIAAKHGYPRPRVFGGAEWEIYRRRKDRVVLTKRDHDSQRLDLSWQTRALGVFKPFWPMPNDARLLPIPASFWPLTFACRPFAGLLRKAGWRHVSSSVGGYLGTPLQLIPELLRFADVTIEDVVMDLGCGDGRVLIEAAHQIGCRGLGYESSTLLCDMARERAKQLGVSELVEIHHEDLSTARVEDASVVFLFLPPENVARLLPDLFARLPKGGRVVAHEILPMVGTPRQSKMHPLFGHSGLTVAHLWYPLCADTCQADK